MGSVVARSNVRQSGPADGPVMVFAHGFGCDQHMWRHVAPRFEATHRVVLYDLAGAGGADLAAYDPDRYATLQGHAEDLLAICRELELADVTFVGHSVSAMIGVLAAAADPGRFARMVFVCPSPRYLDDDGYRGGFGPGDIEELLASLEANHLGWSRAMAPVVMGHPDRPELAEELARSFCRTDPAIARQFARVTFTSDNRADLAGVLQPALVLQCRHDAIAPVEVGEYVRDHLPRATYVVLDTTGHCPNLSAPDLTAAAIADFMAG